MLYEEVKWLLCDGCWCWIVIFYLKMNLDICVKYKVLENEYLCFVEDDNIFDLFL